MRMFLIFSLLLGSFGFTSVVHAQFAIDDDLLIELAPSSPRPGEAVTATLKDYRGASGGATITWSVDGTTQDTVTNQRSFTFTAGSAGRKQTVTATLKKTNTAAIPVTFSFIPVYLDIIIEPQTHVPDFYLGRALPSIGSQVNVTALISGTNLTSNNLIYTWRLNQTVIGGGPIRGLSQTSFDMPMGKQAVLSVEAADTTGNTIARRAIYVPSVRPETYFYTVSTLFGVSQLAMTEQQPLTSNTLTVQAEPYYLDSRIYNNPPRHEWTVDNSTHSNTSGSPYEVTLQRNNTQGKSTVNFHVRDTTQVLQGTEGSVTLNF